MRKDIVAAGVVLIFLSALSGGFAKTAPPAKAVPGTIVLVFKDGHRQSFNLADIARVEFTGAAEAAAASPVSAVSSPEVPA